MADESDLYLSNTYLWHLQMSYNGENTTQNMTTKRTTFHLLCQVNLLHLF